MEPIRILSGAPPAEKISRLKLRRLTCGERFAGIITCLEPLRVPTHWLGGRTLPCLLKECPGCAKGLPQREETYISSINCKKGGHGILALSRSGGISLGLTAPNWENVRGICFTVYREGTKPNGRVTVEIDERIYTTDSLPPAPDMLSQMYNIWGLDQTTLRTDHPLYELRDQFILPLENGNGSRPWQAK